VKNEDRRARTIACIVDASAELLREVGYSRFRTVEVSKRSHTSEGTLFRYFPTKLDLISATLDRTLNDHVTRLIDEFALQPRPLEIRRMLWMLWRLLSHEELLWTYELFSAASTDVELQQTVGPVFDAHSAIVDAATLGVVAELGVPAEDGIKAINLATWSMQSLIIRDLGHGDSGAQERLVNFLATLVDRAYDA
jgi:AcrR family transcriptional regulator